MLWWHYNENERKMRLVEIGHVLTLIRSAHWRRHRSLIYVLEIEFFSCIQTPTVQPYLTRGTRCDLWEGHRCPPAPKASKDEVWKAGVLHVACLPGLRTHNTNPNVKHPYLIPRSCGINLISTRCVAIFLFFSWHENQPGLAATGILPIWSHWACLQSLYVSPKDPWVTWEGGKKGKLRDITHLSLPTFIKKHVYE